MHNADGPECSGLQSGMRLSPLILNVRYFNRSYERGTEIDLIVIESTEALIVDAPIKLDIDNLITSVVLK